MYCRLAHEGTVSFCAPQAVQILDSVITMVYPIQSAVSPDSRATARTERKSVRPATNSRFLPTNVASVSVCDRVRVDTADETDLLVPPYEDTEHHERDREYPRAGDDDCHGGRFFPPG